MTLLQDFLTDWLAWAVTGEDPGKRGYTGEYGLCDAADKYEVAEDLDYGEVYDLLQAEFKADGLAGDYPFGVDEYDSSSELHTQPERLDWVRSKLA